ncbi:hypothetical protein ADUPG1_004365, partial [Aduncisulcus paluster]
MSKAMTFDGSDVNVSAFFLATDLNNSLEVNATAFTNYITSIVGTDYDETNTSNKGNGNFTSGMDLNVSGAEFDYGVMLNVDSYPIVTSDKKWKAERTDVRINSK